MDGQGKLTRTQSSLLRSSSTVRSSIHSLSSICETTNINVDEDHQKKPTKPGGSIPNPNAAARLVSLLAVTATSLTTFIITFIYLNTAEISTSENLLLALIFIAVVLFYLGKNREFLNRSKSTLRSFYKTHRSRPVPVEWYIGDEPVSGSNGKFMVKEGVEFYSNGDFYEGEFYKGKSNGSGVYNYYVNGRYEGDWVDGRYDGYGIESWTKGSRYRGQYRGGFRHGFGVYRFYTGDSYAGEWCNGQYHGVGVQSCSDGSCYVGEFKCGVKHGLGCYHFSNGDRYAGEYFGDKIQGFGVYHFANGHYYEGSWHEGRKQGYGMYTFRNGEPKCGLWDCGSLKTPLTRLIDSVLRAVQAARKAAENGIHLRPVDEQVNKALVAANRAATAARVAAVKAVHNTMDGKFHAID